MQLSRYFTQEEFEHSNTAVQKKIDNRMPAIYLNNATRLCKEFLDPLREILGKSITITSGYRCDALNKAVGGVSTSAHSYGRAADLVFTGYPLLFVYNTIHQAVMTGKLPTPDQVIFEKGIWIHLGIADKPRGQFLRTDDGKTYTNFKF